MTATTLAHRSNPAPTAAAPSTTRPNIYVPIHKGIRACMMDTLARVGRVDVRDEADLSGALEQLEAMLAFNASHLAHEDAHVHPVIEARQPEGTASVAAEHVEHRESIDALRGDAGALLTAPPESRDTLALRLYRHLALFVAESFQHMHFEETVLNATLCALCSDAEIMAIHDRILASVSPADMLRDVRWILPAVPPAQRAEMIGGAKTQMPPEALLAVVTMLRPHLDAAGWTQLCAAAGVSPAIAA